MVTLPRGMGRRAPRTSACVYCRPELFFSFLPWHPCLFQRVDASLCRRLRSSNNGQHSNVDEGNPYSVLVRRPASSPAGKGSTSPARGGLGVWVSRQWEIRTTPWSCSNAQPTKTHPEIILAGFVGGRFRTARIWCDLASFFFSLSDSDRLNRSSGWSSTGLT
ncbi:hypothetical protein N657DRAFT_205511 [Parathielavia appendiculata]|uniref:Uncharacterized protein n=1 Tax=Parathielavia appendiculata TaxID=2587402 RepID=A0AAN6U6E7_9PEZI|nr:hypothetical protein N657DRAFT_205511 [Parathielavia appendiculata]